MIFLWKKYIHKLFVLTRIWFCYFSTMDRHGLLREGDFVTNYNRITFNVQKSQWKYSTAHALWLPHLSKHVAHCLCGSEMWWQQGKQSSPGFFLPSHVLQFLPTEAFPGPGWPSIAILMNLKWLCSRQRSNSNFVSQFWMSEPPNSVSRLQRTHWRKMNAAKVTYLLFFTRAYDQNW